MRRSGQKKIKRKCNNKVERRSREKAKVELPSGNRERKQSDNMERK